MWNYLKKIFINGRHEGNLVVKNISREQLILNMKYPKDFHIKTYSDGKETATCNLCEANITILNQNGLVWYICSVCNLTSFNPVENFHRDVEIAKEYGGVIEHDKYYIKDTPKGFEAPSIN